MGSHFTYLQSLKNGTAKPVEKKKVKAIAKKSAKKILKDIDQKPEKELLNKWFDDRISEITGKCQHCGAKTSGRASIAHLLPKKLFKSVAMHPLNFIELCFYPPSCHTNFDSSMLDVTMMKCWPLMLERFLIILPDIDKKEFKYLPEYFKQEIPI